MRSIFLYILMLFSTVVASAQPEKPDRHMDIQGVRLEGFVYTFSEALKKKGYVPEDTDDESLNGRYFRGDYYGLKVNLLLSVDDDTNLLSSAFVYYGPFSSAELIDKNYRYLLLKLQREYGNFKAKGDGSLYFKNDYGIIQIAKEREESGYYSITVSYLITSQFYKDAVNLGLKGNVREVATDNAIVENPIEKFEENGKSEDSDLLDREYDKYGRIVKAAMKEKTGLKSTIDYEYDTYGRLSKRTLTNALAHIKYVNEYLYRDDDQLAEMSQRVYDRNNECIMSIVTENTYEEFDEKGNWIKNHVKLTYWEEDQQPQVSELEQTRTITYW